MTIDENRYNKCKESALRIIERSNKTESQIKQKLAEKGYCDEDIQRVIQFLKEYKFIDDKSYIDIYINSRIKKQGIIKIKYDLQRKGLSQELIEEKIGDVSKEIQEQVAITIGNKKYTQLLSRGIEQNIINNKLISFLLGKGYDYTIAKNATKEIMKK